MKLSEIKVNKSNPRIIKDEKFKKLIKSLEDFPKMMEFRPIVVNDDGMILGGNMRYRALLDLGYKEVPDNWVKKASDLTDDEKRRFIIVDNLSFGEHDWDALANEWDAEQLEDWGLTVNNFNTDSINLDSFFEEDNSEKINKNKIVLEYTDEEFDMVNEAFKNHSGSKEQIVFKLLGL